MLESNNWTVHMHAPNCIFNLRHRNGNVKNVVCLILKRYAVGNFKIWSYAVHMPKIKKYALTTQRERGSPSFITIDKQLK